MKVIIKIAFLCVAVFKPVHGLNIGYSNILAGPNENPNKRMKTPDKSGSTENENTFKLPAFEDTMQIKFYGPVSEQSCLELSQVISYMDTKARQLKVLHEDYNPKIHLHIQSSGGSLMPAFYICDLIKNTKTPIYTYVDGYCASAASLISVCGDKRFMTKHSSILIHQLSSAAAGKYNELKNEVDNLSVFMNAVREIYMENTNIDRETLDSLLSTDLWLDSETCLAYGLADELLQ
jgi:ATP-dependent protease ClpP protease subunit